MPLVEKPRGYDKIVGIGIEKLVSGTSSPEAGIKPMVAKDTYMYFDDTEKSPNFVKAQYYLTKLIHKLFPANVPDVYFTSINEGDKITMDQRVEVVDGERTKRKEKADPFTSKRINAVQDIFRNLGLNFDQFDWNFNVDKDGNIIYMDSFRPWFDFERTGAPILKLNVVAVNKLIENIKDARSKEECTNYLERIKFLYDQEMDVLNKQNKIIV